MEGSRNIYSNSDPNSTLQYLTGAEGNEIEKEKDQEKLKKRKLTEKTDFISKSINSNDPYQEKNKSLTNRKIILGENSLSLSSDQIERLMAKSDYFAQLLSPNFLETSQEEITIREEKLHSRETLIALNFCLQNTPFSELNDLSPESMILLLEIANYLSIKDIQLKIMELFLENINNIKIENFSLLAETISFLEMGTNVQEYKRKLCCFVLDSPLIAEGIYKYKGYKYFNEDALFMVSYLKKNGHHLKELDFYYPNHKIHNRVFSDIGKWCPNIEIIRVEWGDMDDMSFEKELEKEVCFYWDSIKSFKKLKEIVNNKSHLLANVNAELKTTVELRAEVRKESNEIADVTWLTVMKKHLEKYKYEDYEKYQYD